MNKSSIAILFSGGTDSLSLYAMTSKGNHKSINMPERIHLLYMMNGMSRFPSFPRERYRIAKELMAAQAGIGQILPETSYVELDTGRLFQGLWLDRYEDLMPQYNGKNLVCVACKLSMHAKAIIYCAQHNICTLFSGYTKKQNYYPEQTLTFMEKMDKLSEPFGVETRYPIYDDFTDEIITRHFLEDQGLPSTGGGERKCLFSQTYTTATEEDTRKYLDDMIPKVTDYVRYVLNGRVKEAAECFLPGRIRDKLIYRGSDDILHYNHKKQA